MARRVITQRGRPKKEGELAERRKDVFFTPSEWKEIEAHLEEQKQTLGTAPKPGTFIHDVAMRVVKGEIAPDELDLPSYDYRAPFLTRAPAGPWQVAIEHAGHFVLSEQAADYLEARDGDVICGVMGESMEGRRLVDGDLLLMRPVSNARQPVRGEIVLVQTWNEAGDYSSTIKQWQGMNGNRPHLVDGDGNDYEWPEDSIGWAAVAVAKGLIARL